MFSPLYSHASCCSTLLMRLTSVGQAALPSRCTARRWLSKLIGIGEAHDWSASPAAEHVHAVVIDDGTSITSDRCTGAEPTCTGEEVDDVHDFTLRWPAS